jgi:hypothetical protein
VPPHQAMHPTSHRHIPMTIKIAAIDFVVAHNNLYTSMSLANLFNMGACC